MSTRYFIEIKEYDTLNELNQETSTFIIKTTAPIEYFQGFCLAYKLNYEPIFEKTTLICKLRCSIEKYNETILTDIYHCEKQKIKLLH